MALKGRIGFAGCGNMGGALLKGMLSAGVAQAPQVVVAEVDAERAKQLSTDLDVATVAAPAELSDLDLLILAVKPGLVARAAQEAAQAMRPGSLVITLAAGLKLATVALALPAGQALVRAMPNTPALVGKGVTAVCADPVQDSAYLDIAREVFGAVGPVVTVEEKLMDAVTALSGSGPAYVYVMIEALADAGVCQGLDRATALTLATHTVAGAAHMVIKTGEHPGVLKDWVTSPGGTTAAGMAELERGGVRGVIYQVIEAATRRGKELDKK
ncbi:pyrroline-5-carboxylate reductase [Desulfoferula mesophila]|uniref:Pyrroline-5-carboxylate reductase n=1 Tax=Desulfoferula mesophila TaxID=3058419 RepID=A0AAU9EEE3_9BACT|nr:pyrroline-5-carboxylate reductase [Desulfoferula mesophilus]